ncbi:fungal-specific transcription factor domain-containing protein [Amylostereum chailletii]|nr:fungal-specific transcription factor domain-containing protein [Amylostereum chailletii]
MTQSPVKAYAQSLENRLRRMEGLFAQLHPDLDFSEHQNDNGPESPPKQQSSSRTHLPSVPPTPFMPSMLDDASEGPALDVDEDEFSETSETDLVEHLRSLNVNSTFGCFYGKSSGMLLFQKALNFKSEVSGQEAIKTRRLSRRPDYWHIQPWERARCRQRRPTAYTFPPPDLMSSLVDYYFRYVDPISPLFHRPTFDRQIADGLHLFDDGIGAVVSLVCALGSRFSDDPRVLLDDSEKPNHPHSAGWVWFNQVQLVRNVGLADPALTDLQVCALGTLYVFGSGTPQICWTLSGIGLRMAQDIGAHRRRAYVDHSPLETDLWRRAFWVLFSLDVWLSAFLGRTCGISVDGIDNPFPLDRDDDYWDLDPREASQQSPGKPSKMTCFVYWSKLYLILAHALRTIYSPDKPRIIAKIGEQEWRRRTVSVLDSELNEWFDSLPNHLRWDPTREDEMLFMQTGYLHAGYHMVLIAIHRPFIPSFGKGSALSFPSLAISVHAARACAHILETQRLRHPGMISSHLLLPAFNSGITLLLGIWGARRMGLTLDAANEIENVHTCIRFISTGENRWSVAGRLRDLLLDLTAAGDLPLPESPPSATGKRGRCDDGEGRNTGVSTTDLRSSEQHPDLRRIAGERRLSRETSELSTLGPPLSAEDKQRLEAGVLQSFGRPPGLNRTGYPPIMSISPVVSSVMQEPALLLSDGTSYDNFARVQMTDAYSTVIEPAHNRTAMFSGEQTPSHGLQTRQPTTITEGTESAGSSLDIDAIRGDKASMDYFSRLMPQDLDGQMVVDEDMMAIWSTLPNGFQAEDWDAYLSNFVGMTDSNAFGDSSIPGLLETQLQPGQAATDDAYGQTSL